MWDKDRLGGEKKKEQAGCQWLMPANLATQKAEIRSIWVQSQLQAKSLKNPISKKKKKKSQRKADRVPVLACVRA
jgi:hypothetical protein